MTDLERVVKQAQDAYYDGDPIMSDEEFDALWENLKETQPDSNLLKSVGQDTVFKKVKHISPMGSQDKAKNAEEFKLWWEKNKGPEYVAEYKYDGASLELQYEKGILKTAITRGDGVYGDEILENALKMEGVPKKLKKEFTGAIRGEVLIRHSNFEKYFSEMKNCRNAAVGTMKSKDGSNCHRLTFVSYNVWDLNRDIDSEILSYEFLIENGFIAHKPKIVSSVEAIIKIRDNLDNYRKSEGFDMDGIVIKPNVIDFEDLEKNPRPKSQIAFKPELETAVTKVIAIEWSHKGRMYTPVAIMEPVILDGTTVQRASLCNPQFLEDSGVNVGSMVVVSKRGQIIPKIERVLL